MVVAGAVDGTGEGASVVGLGVADGVRGFTLGALAPGLLGGRTGCAEGFAQDAVAMARKGRANRGRRISRDLLNLPTTAAGVFVWATTLA